MNTKNIVSALDAKTHLSRLLQEVQGGMKLQLIIAYEKVKNN